MSSGAPTPLRNVHRDVEHGGAAAEIVNEQKNGFLIGDQIPRSGFEKGGLAGARPRFPLQFSIAGVVFAIAATTTMDATGLSAFSALALFPLMLLFCYLERLSPTEVGFKLASSSSYGLAVAYPIVVIGAIGAIAFLAGAIDLSKTNWQKTGLNLVIITIVTFLVAMITEEGFFRGWLWGSLRRASFAESHILIWSSIAFALWHISAVTLDKDFRPSHSQIPIFLVNAAMMGAVWGLLRAISGSIVVSSLSHGLWNGMAYVLFGFGTHAGALGVRNITVFGPELGFLGLTSNALLVGLLWRYWKTRAVWTTSRR